MTRNDHIALLYVIIAQLLTLVAKGFWLVAMPWWIVFLPTILTVLFVITMYGLGFIIGMIIIILASTKK